MANGTMHGEDTSCKEREAFCPEFWYVTHYDNRERSTRFEEMEQHIAPKYGEYVDFYSTIKFTQQQLSPDNAYYAMLIKGLGK